MELQKRKKVTTVSIIIAIVVILLLSVVYNLKNNPELNGFYRLIFGEQIISGEMTPLDTGVTYRTQGYIDTVAITSGGKITFVKKNGQGEEKGDLSMNAPLFHSSGDYMIVGDTDGTSAVVFQDKKKVHSLKSEAPIFMVKINSNGYFIIVSEEKGYKALVTIYSPAGNEIYKWHSGDRNVLDADVDYDGTAFKVALLDTESGSASGKLLFFDIKKTEPIAEIPTEGNLVCSIKVNRDHSLTALGDQALSKYSPNGTLLWTVPFENRALLNADISSVDRLVIVLASEENSGLYTDKSMIYVYNRNGKEKNVNEIEGQIESFSVAGDTAVGLIDKKIAVIDLFGSGNILLTPDRDIRSVTLFASEDRVLALSPAGYEVLKVR